MSARVDIREAWAVVMRLASGRLALAVESIALDRETAVRRAAALAGVDRVAPGAGTPAGVVPVLVTWDRDDLEALP
jgi:hypothetical protein